MKTNNYVLHTLLIIVLLACTQDSRSNDATWVPGGEDDWNIDANWLNVDGQNFVPEAGFGDAPVIANGGTAFLEAAALGNDDPFPSVTVSNGGLEIRAGGELNTETLTIGEAGSMLLSGNGSLSVSGDAITSGQTRIEGPDVTVAVSGDLSLGGSFEARITASDHSAVGVGGTANLAASFRPEFDGVTPALGDSWAVIDADSVNGSLSVDTSLAPALEPGVIYATAVDTAQGNVNLVVTNTLELVVNRRTGAATLGNVVGDPISIDSYVISSPSSLLNPAAGAWSSLADSGGVGGGWTEGESNSDAITESKAGDPGSIEVGSPVDLGAPVVPTNFMPEDLALSFSAGGVSLPGLVTYEGIPFNLILTVDPETGAGSITNRATIPIEFDGYAIQSASGSLAGTDAWTSLAESGAGGEGWNEANPTSNALAELNPTSTTVLAPNQSLALGTVFETASEADLAFSFFLAGADPDLRAGFVAYGMDVSTGPEPLPGDADGDGDVDFDDFVILSNTFNQPADPPGSGADFSGNGTVDFDDFVLLSNNFGRSAAASIPEPTSFALFCVAGLLAGSLRRRRS